MIQKYKSIQFKSLDKLLPNTNLEKTCILAKKKLIDVCEKVCYNKEYETWECNGFDGVLKL